MESLRFTEAELAALIAETVSWCREQREKFLPSSTPLDEAQKIELNPFFTKEILDRFRIVNLSNTGKTIPYPPFYEKVRAGGTRSVPDAAHMTAMPFLDVTVFNVEPVLRSLFHNLVHFTQIEIVGLEEVIKCYFRTLGESGQWVVVPFEEQAYHLDARYTRAPADIFSVEEEVREWLRSGRFRKE